MKTRNNPVVRINPRTGKKKKYPNARAACESMGLDLCTLRNAVWKRLDMGTYAGFEWEPASPRDKPITPGPFSGLKHSKATKDKMSAAKNKKKVPVGRFDLNGTLLEVFSSVTDAHKKGYHRSNIISVLLGNRKTSGGFLWKKL